MKIGLISDTHGWLDPQVFTYFESCDEIWHAGDIGTPEVMHQLEAFKPSKAVYGNIDGRDLRMHYPEQQHFICEGLRVFMTHIGGLPPTYTPDILQTFQQKVPDLFICGHSHILRVIRDKVRPTVLYLNPGAAGRYGIHTVRTLLRFEIIQAQLCNLEAIELGRRSDTLPILYPFLLIHKIVFMMMALWFDFVYQWLHGQVSVAIASATAVFLLTFCMITKKVVEDQS
eukprot:gene181-240_t